MEITIGVPQRSVAGLVLFHTFISDTFWFANRAKICNYADDIPQPFTYHPDLDIIVTQLEEDSYVVVKSEMAPGKKCWGQKLSECRRRAKRAKFLQATPFRLA